MKTPESRTWAIRSWICGTRRSYCAFTSTRGIALGTRAESRGSLSKQQVQHQEDCSCHDHHIDVVEGVVERLVARAQRPADAGQHEAPDGREIGRATV